MATAINSSPIGGYNLNPAYNPIVFSVQSGLVNLPNFRYAVDVINEDTSELITRLEIPPIAPSGQGVFDISHILSNFVTHQNINQNYTGDDASDSYINYRVQTRERYQVSYGFTSITQSVSSTNFSAFTQLNFEIPTPFQPNDQIINFLTSGDNLLAGILTVIDVINDTTIVVNRQWNQLVTSGLTLGDSIFADGRKFTSDIEVDQVGRAFNAALTNVQLKDYAPAQYSMGTAFLGKLLTNMPQEFTVRENTHLGINFFNGTNTNNRRLQITNGVTTKYLSITGTTGKALIYLAMGPGNIDESQFTLLSGPNEIITSGGSPFYEALVTNSSNGPISQRYKFNLDYTCSKWEDYCVVFLDKLGSLGAFSFIYANSESQQVNRQLHNKQIGNSEGSAWSFNAEEASFRPTFIEAEKRIQLNTAWLTQVESEYFQELITSPACWININNEFWPINVITSSSIKEDKRRTKNIRYTVDFEFANRDSINW